MTKIKIQFKLQSFFLFILFFCVKTSLLAMPAYPGRIEHLQPDGTHLTVLLKGDENLHWAESEDGYTLLRNAKGYFEFALVEKDGSLIPSGHIATNINLRTPATKALLETTIKHAQYSKPQIQMLRQIRGLKRAQGSTTVSKSFPNTGTRKLVCLLMDFPDVPFKKTKADFVNLFNQVEYSANSATGSVRDFFKESSYGQLDLSVTVAGPFRSANNLAYYGANLDTNVPELVAEGINQADATVNFADFDNDNDNYVDGVYVIYAGYGEESGAPVDGIWAHAFQLTTPLTKDGKTFSSYSCSSELSGNSGTIINSIGIICHEFGHTLGAPDFYDTDYDRDGQYGGTGNWDLQASAAWNNGGRTPAHPNAYTKCYIYNWATPTTLTAAQSITLNNSTQNKTSFYRYDTGTVNEFYLLENRQKVGFDSYIPGHGLLIYHVDEHYLNIHSVGNDINTTSHQGMYIVPAGSTMANGVESPPVNLNSTKCPYPGTALKTQFTEYSTPNSLTWAGVNPVKQLLNITENTTDKTMSLDFADGLPCTPPTVAPTRAISIVISDNAIMLSWTRGNGTGVIVLAKEATAVDAKPISGSIYSASDVFGTVEIGTANYIVYQGPAPIFTVSNLKPGTTYHFAVYEFNATTNCYNLSALVANATTTGEIPACTRCTSSGNMDYNTSMTQVTLNNIKNISAKTTGYTDYTSTISTTVHPTASYPLSIKINTGGAGSVYATVWIDWNQNCEMDNTGEEYLLGSATTVTDNLTSLSPLNITVPATATLGTTIMRVSCMFGRYPTACETSFDGEVEDYRIVVANIGTDIQTNSISNTHNVYPNPVSDELTIEQNLNQPASNYELCNLMGQLLEKGTLTTNGKIKMKSYKEGIYVLKISIGKQAVYHKVIKR